VQPHRAAIANGAQAVRGGFAVDQDVRDYPMGPNVGSHSGHRGVYGHLGLAVLQCRIQRISHRERALRGEQAGRPQLRLDRTQQEVDTPTALAGAAWTLAMVQRSADDTGEALMLARLLRISAALLRRG
jgi:hypothetical protein